MAPETESPIALGHLRLSVTDIAGAVSFFEAIGARTDVRKEDFAVVELRDRTRLQMRQSADAIPAGTALQFDFKVEDIDAAWRHCQAKGLNPAEIVRRRPGHDVFVLSGPDACEVQIVSGYNRA